MLYSTQTHVAVDRLGPIDGVKALIKAGYPALDYSFFWGVDNPQVPELSLMRELRAIADEAGVIFNQAHAPFGGGREKYTTLTLPLLPDVFRCAGVLGVRQIIVHPIQDGPFPGREKELFDLNVDFYRNLAPYAKENGLKIALENMWQKHPVSGYIRDDVLAPPEQLAALYDTLDDPDAFTVCLDIGHVTLCGREPEDAIKTLGHDRLGALHVHDTDYKADLHTLPGMSRINWKKVTDALGAIDYKGEFTLEADNFLIRYPNEHLPVAMRFMADTARFYAEQVDLARVK